MAEILLFDRDKTEQEIIKNKVSDSVARLSDDYMNLRGFSVPTDVKTQLEKDADIDMSMLEVLESGDIDLIRYVRKCIDRADMMLLADSHISPMEYMTPDIRACSLILKPFDEEELEKVVHEFVASYYRKNEEADELYLCGLLALCNLREFVRTVDKVEKGIDDEQRLAYRQMYIPKIEELKDLLDDERIELIQKKKNMRKDVQRVLESDDPRTWEEVSWLYLNRSKLERNKDLLNEFMVCASDAGLEQGHFSAALYFMYPLRDYKEAERRLFMLYNSKSEHTSYDARELLSAINFYLELGNEITVGMQEIIDGLSERGFNIEKSEGGFYGLVEENDSAYKAEQENYKVDVQKVIKEVLSRKKNNRHLTSHNNHRGKK